MAGFGCLAHGAIRKTGSWLRVMMAAMATVIITARIGMAGIAAGLETGVTTMAAMTGVTATIAGKAKRACFSW